MVEGTAAEIPILVIELTPAALVAEVTGVALVSTAEVVVFQTPPVFEVCNVGIPLGIKLGVIVNSPPAFDVDPSSFEAMEVSSPASLFLGDG